LLLGVHAPSLSQTLALGIVAALLQVRPHLSLEIGCSWWMRCKRQLEFGQQIFGAPRRTLRHDRVFGRIGGEVTLRGKLRTICVHSAAAAVGKIFSDQDLKLGLNTKPLRNTRIEAGG